jgi:hypothetical protein
MGKKGGKSKGKVSMGLRSSSVKTASKHPADRVMNQLKAFRAGKKVVVTIANPNKAETNKPFIRVNGKDWFKPESNLQGNN